MGFEDRIPTWDGTAMSRCADAGGRCSTSRRSLHTMPSADPASKRSHSSSSVRFTARRKSSICSAVSNAEWLRGWPAIGRPHPLIV